MSSPGFDLFLVEANLSDEFRASVAAKIRRMREANRRRVNPETEALLDANRPAAEQDT